MRSAPIVTVQRVSSKRSFAGVDLTRTETALSPRTSPAIQSPDIADIVEETDLIPVLDPLSGFLVFIAASIEVIAFTTSFLRMPRVAGVSIAEPQSEENYPMLKA